MSEPFLNVVYYFGCWRESGHYLHAPGMQRVWDCSLAYLDGILAPAGIGEREFLARAWRLHGYVASPYSAFSWWDRSVDKRNKSNSTIFVPGDTVTIGSMWKLAVQYYPEVFDRLPPILFQPEFHLRTKP